MVVVQYDLEETVLLLEILQVQEPIAEVTTIPTMVLVEQLTSQILELLELQ